MAIMTLNNNIKIKIVDLSGGVLPLPTYAKDGDAGMDVRAFIPELLKIKPREHKLINTGIKISIPKGYSIDVRPRSGLAYKNGITVLNSPGTIDPGFIGSLGVILINHSNEIFIVNPGDRIAQIVLNKVPTIQWEQVDELDSTDRGEGGFGSTGT